MTSDTPHTGTEDDDSLADEDLTAEESVTEQDPDTPQDDPMTDQGPDSTGEENEQEFVPELDSDVYRKPFAEYDTSDPEDIANAVSPMNAQAATKIKEIHRLNQKLEKKGEHLQEKATEAQQELQEFRRRKNDETEEIKETATKDFIRDAVPIRDNLERALDQESDDIRSGIELIKQNFDELLENEGVTIIEPEPGEKVDPEVHEVMTRVESEYDDGLIDECFHPGYSMEGYVIRPARVTVSSGDNEE